MKSLEYDFVYAIHKCIFLFKHIDPTIKKGILHELQDYIHKIIYIFQQEKDKERHKNTVLEYLIAYLQHIFEEKIYPLLKPSQIQEIDQIVQGVCQKKYGVETKKVVFKNIPLPSTFLSTTNTVDEEIQQEINILSSQKKEENNISSEESNLSIHKICEFIFEKNQEMWNEYQQKLHEKIKFYVEEQIHERIKTEMTVKMEKVSSIFNEYIHQLVQQMKIQFQKNEEETLHYLEEKIEKNSKENHIDKNGFRLDYNNNEIQLFFKDVLISSAKMKGFLGPKGPAGNKGDKGDTPIIRKLNVTDSHHLKMTVQNSNEIYDVTSMEKLPTGPPGPPGPIGPKGDDGKSVIELKWNQSDVMKINDENSLHLLKSLCIGDKGNCFKYPSMTLGNAICYQPDSIAIGNQSKTWNTQSIAFFGSCLGKNAFSYRADNVDTDIVQFGKKEKSISNIREISLNSSKFTVNADKFIFNGKIIELEKVKEMEHKILYLEEKIAILLSKNDCN